MRNSICADSLITNCTLHKFQAVDGALVIEDCSGITLSALSLTECVGGIVLRSTRDSMIANCRSLRQAGDGPAVSVDAASANVARNGNQFGASVDDKSGGN